MANFDFSHVPVERKEVEKPDDWFVYAERLSNRLLNMEEHIQSTILDRSIECAELEGYVLDELGWARLELCKLINRIP